VRQRRPKVSALLAVVLRRLVPRRETQKVPVVLEEVLVLRAVRQASRAPEQVPGQVGLPAIPVGLPRTTVNGYHWKGRRISAANGLHWYEWRWVGFDGPGRRSYLWSMHSIGWNNHIRRCQWGSLSVDRLDTWNRIYGGLVSCSFGLT